jgi:hypothetical protein
MRIGSPRGRKVAAAAAGLKVLASRAPTHALPCRIGGRSCNTGLHRYIATLIGPSAARQPHPSLVPSFRPTATPLRFTGCSAARSSSLLVPGPQGAQGRSQKAIGRRSARSPATRFVRDEAFWRSDGLTRADARIAYPVRADQNQPTQILWRNAARARSDLALLGPRAADWGRSQQRFGARHTTSVRAATIGLRAHALLLPPNACRFLAPRCQDRRCELDLVRSARNRGRASWSRTAPFCLLGVRGPAAAPTRGVCSCPASPRRGSRRPGTS